MGAGTLGSLSGEPPAVRPYPDFDPPFVVAFNPHGFRLTATKGPTNSGHAYHLLPSRIRRRDNHVPASISRKQGLSSAFFIKEPTFLVYNANKQTSPNNHVSHVNIQAPCRWRKITQKKRFQK